MEAMLLKLAGRAALFAEDARKDGGAGGGDLVALAVPASLRAHFRAVLFSADPSPAARAGPAAGDAGAVKKNDRVVTVGGIYGVVTNVHREADEVTLKVDEATNTKLRVTLSSIGRVLGDEPSDEPANK